MVGSRRLALDLQQDIATSDDTSCVTKKLEDKSVNEIEQICAFEIDGRTVFQTIASHDRANILEKILSYGVNINRVDSYAVHVAISQKAVNVMKILLNHKANIDRVTEDGKTPLHIASELGYIKIVKELLENGAKPMINQVEKTGCTPLTLACMTDHRETATCLIIYGAAINFEQAFPPLHAASLMGYTDLVRMLLDRGAFVNLRDVKSETPLHYASYKSHKQIVQLLLQKGAKVSCFDGRGKTPVDLATDEDIKRLLENKLKTESNSNLKGRRDSGSRKSVPLDTVPVNPIENEPNIDNAIFEENEPEESGGQDSDMDKHKRVNSNYSNNSSEDDQASPGKKMSEQSTYSADSETGERKTKTKYENTSNNVHKNDRLDGPSTSKDMNNGKISEECNDQESSSETSDTDDDEDDDVEEETEESKKKGKKSKKKKGCVIS